MTTKRYALSTGSTVCTKHIAWCIVAQARHLAVSTNLRQQSDRRSWRDRCLCYCRSFRLSSCSGYTSTTLRAPGQVHLETPGAFARLTTHRTVDRRAISLGHRGRCRYRCSCSRRRWKRNGGRTCRWCSCSSRWRWDRRQTRGCRGWWYHWSWLYNRRRR